MREAQGVVWAMYETPWGRGRVGVRGQRLVAVDVPRLDDRSSALADPSRDMRQMHEEETPARDHEAAHRWAKALEAYFRGERLCWDETDISLDALEVGEFARRVYSALLWVPAGTTVTYGELAGRAGHPRAARAVGSAMAGNPIPIVVPCHRVVRADGSLGCYGDDPRWKPILLEHERRHREVPR